MCDMQLEMVVGERDNPIGKKRTSLVFATGWVTQSFADHLPPVSFCLVCCVGGKVVMAQSKAPT